VGFVLLVLLALLVLGDPVELDELELLDGRDDEDVLGDVLDERGADEVERALLLPELRETAGMKTPTAVGPTSAHAGAVNPPFLRASTSSCLPAHDPGQANDGSARYM
jgi:hypothetical protein